MSTAKESVKRPIKRNENQKGENKAPNFPVIEKVSIGSAFLTVTLKDGRIIKAPYSWFPPLQKASPSQRLKYTHDDVFIYWDNLDEIISVKNLLGPGATGY